MESAPTDAARVWSLSQMKLSNNLARRQPLPADGAVSDSLTGTDARCNRFGDTLRDKVFIVLVTLALVLGIARRILAAGLTKEVTFEPIEGGINDQIDAAYRTKYAKSPYLGSMIGDQARHATVKVTPKDGPTA